MAILILLRGQKISNGEMIPPPPPPPPPPLPAQNLNIEEIGIKIKNERFPECSSDSLSRKELDKC
jgi:hypothetical protein